ncbi:Tc-38 domain-containing protein [Burkholderia diffusa]|uniref:Tc-38 domain-containing protein n=1 Tax=Burkholderia diffusa TaxID=488732 RepID=UPI003AF506BD
MTCVNTPGRLVQSSISDCLRQLTRRRQCRAPRWRAPDLASHDTHAGLGNQPQALIGYFRCGRANIGQAAARRSGRAAPCRPESA